MVISSFSVSQAERLLEETSGVQNLRIVSFKMGPHSNRIGREKSFSTIGAVADVVNPKKFIRVIVEPVIAEFVLDPDPNQNGTGHAHSEAQDIDQRESFVSPKVSPCQFHKIFQHGIS
jgi:hypothetical protein